MSYKSIEWSDPGCLRILDQRALPSRIVYIDCTTVQEVATAIETMAVRGAPAIGATAAYGIAIAARTSVAADTQEFARDLEIADARLRISRPTAVNLSWALDQMRSQYHSTPDVDRSTLEKRLMATAHRLAQHDIDVNKAIAERGAELLKNDSLVIHHCNTGSLATVGYGTALGIIRHMHETERGISVLVDETRPRLQGARLTCWELAQLGVPHRLIVDGASGHFMRTETVDACLVGCDRVAANGDVANKIGTYNLALAAQAHGVPFYVAAPASSIDLSVPDGSSIPIEERTPEEVTSFGQRAVAPEGTRVANPAFDVTPSTYVTAFITEHGIVRPPFGIGLRELLESALVQRKETTHEP